MRVWMCAPASSYVTECVWMFAPAFVFVKVCVCACAKGRLPVCRYFPVSEDTSHTQTLCHSTFQCVCIPVYFFILYTHLFWIFNRAMCCVHVCVDARACVCVCVHVYMWACVRVHGREYSCKFSTSHTLSPWLFLSFSLSLSHTLAHMNTRTHTTQNTRLCPFFSSLRSSAWVTACTRAASAR